MNGLRQALKRKRVPFLDRGQIDAAKALLL